MTLDEAIKHAEGVAEEKENEGRLLCQSEVASIGCLTCAEEHRQLAEWLKDYKRLLEQKPKIVRWEKTTDGYCYWYKCSYCGTKAPKNEWYSDYFSPYCPECGAMMVESQKREDEECSNCAKSWTDNCPRDKCWDNDYSEFIKESEVSE